MNEVELTARALHDANNRARVEFGCQPDPDYDGLSDLSVSILMRTAALFLESRAAANVVIHECGHRVDSPGCQAAHRMESSAGPDYGGPYDMG